MQKNLINYQKKTGISNSELIQLSLDFLIKNLKLEGFEENDSQITDLLLRNIIINSINMHTIYQWNHI